MKLANVVKIAGGPSLAIAGGPSGQVNQAIQGSAGGSAPSPSQPAVHVPALENQLETHATPKASSELSAPQQAQVAMAHATMKVTRSLLAQNSDPPQPDSAGEKSDKKILECCEQKRLSGDSNDPTNAQFWLQKLSAWCSAKFSRGDELPQFVPRLMKFFISHCTKCTNFCDAQTLAPLLKDSP